MRVEHHHGISTIVAEPFVEPPGHVRPAERSIGTVIAGMAPLEALHIGGAEPLRDRCCL